MVLSKMARSPHLRSIFLDFEFKPVYLPEEHAIAPPTDISFWMHGFQAMSIEGSDLKRRFRYQLRRSVKKIVDLKMVISLIKFLRNVYKRPLTRSSIAKSTLRLRSLAIFRAVTYWAKPSILLDLTSSAVRPAWSMYILPALQSRWEAPTISGTHGT